MENSKMKKISNLLLLSGSIIFVPVTFAQTDANTQNKAQTTYGDNPNLLRVLAGKTQSAVQNTAEKVGAATEKGIAKIKPSVNQTWNNTKEYTTEKAVIARDNTRQGIDTAVKKVKQTKENIVGTSGPNNVPIERGSLSQSNSNATTQNLNQNPDQNQSQNQSQIYSQTQTQHPVPTLSSPMNTMQSNSPSTTSQTSTQNQSSTVVEPEIKRQAIPMQSDPTQNGQMAEDAETGLPR